MAFLQIQGIDEYVDKLRKASRNSEKIIKKAVYKGAEVVADSVKAGLQSIPVDNRYGTEENKVNGVSRKQKSDLIKSMGLSPIKEQNGYINTKLGFDGYGSIRTKKYPQGVPNQLLARSIESGTSFRKKTPVIRKSANNAKQQAIDKMSKTIDEELRKEFE